MPEARRPAVFEGFADSMDFIKNKINEYADGLCVKPTGNCWDWQRMKRVAEEPGYDDQKNILYMDEREDNDEYVETFRHELGHFIDARMDFLSLEEHFSQAITADLEWYDVNTSAGISTMGEMLSELSTSSAIDNRCVSDILSGLFFDMERVRNAVETVYNRLGIAIYGHEDEYWKEVKGPQNAVASEVFADLFSIYSENDNKAVCFIEKWFPNVTKRFQSSLEKEGIRGIKNG